MKKKSLIMATCVALVLVLGLAVGAWAGPDTLSFTDIVTVPASTINGKNADVGTVNAGDTISLSFKMGGSGTAGSTTYAHTEYITATTLAPPSPSTVTVDGLQSSYTLDTTSSKVSVSATLTAPSTAGAYQVKFQASDGITGAGHMNQDSCIVKFSVNTPPCTATPTHLSLGTPDCVLLHATSVVSLTATLTDEDNTPIGGKTIDFYLDGVADSIGSAVTDNLSGVATLTYDPSSLSAGDHTLIASWKSDDDCLQSSTADAVTLGVQYLFVGFQPPISPNAILTGKCGPVKVVITDANGVPQSDAIALVFFELGTPTIVGTDATNVTASLNFDYGNAMRYDPSAGQYVYNWDLSGLTPGTYTIRVFFQNEGICAGAHQVVISVGKKGGK